jgi:carbonic anhydrase
MQIARLIVIGFLSAGALIGCRSPAANRSSGTPHWSYEGSTGPQHWGSLAPEYALCATGKRQSPIDIGQTVAGDLPNVSFHYQIVPVEIINNGHTLQVNYAPGSYIELDGRRFDLLQFHFHSPSEHRVRGHEADAEMHLVHKSSAGELAVVALFIESGAYNPGFDAVCSNVPAVVGSAHPVDAAIDADTLFPHDQRTFRYDGSLTTPPGTEGVRWVLIKQPVTMSPGQLASLRRVLGGNNRPTQKLHGRVVAEDSTR